MEEENNVQLILSQVQVNREILQMFAQAKTTLTFISMMSQFHEPELVEAVNDALERGIQVKLFHSVNPYVAGPTATQIAELFPSLPSTSFSFRNIPMHGKKLPNLTSILLGGVYDSDMHTNVTHSRFISNDTHCMYGGVDFNKTCEDGNYVQHAMKLSFQNTAVGARFNNIKQQVEELVLELASKGNLRNYSPLRFVSSTIIASSAVNISGLECIISMIEQAKCNIFIENQYFQHAGVLSAIAKRQMQHPSLKVVLIGNYDFDLNPYHPGKHFFWLGLSRLAAHRLRNETIKGLTYLREIGCTFEFRTYKGKYTHNKIFIADHGKSIAIGTFNLHTRSLDAGNDCEMGIFLDVGNESSGTMSAISEYIDSVMKETQNMNHIIPEMVCGNIACL